MKRKTGTLALRLQAQLGGGKFAAHHNLVSEWLVQHGNLTLNELCVERRKRGAIAHRSGAGWLLY